MESTFKLHTLEPFSLEFSDVAIHLDASWCLWTVFQRVSMCVPCGEKVFDNFCLCISPQFGFTPEHQGTVPLGIQQWFMQINERRFVVCATVQERLQQHRRHRGIRCIWTPPGNNRTGKTYMMSQSSSTCSTSSISLRMRRLKLAWNRTSSSKISALSICMSTIWGGGQEMFIICKLIRKKLASRIVVDSWLPSDPQTVSVKLLI